MVGEVYVEVLLYLAICIMASASFHWTISPITTSPFPAEASLFVSYDIFYCLSSDKSVLPDVPINNSYVVIFRNMLQLW